MSQDDGSSSSSGRRIVMRLTSPSDSGLANEISIRRLEERGEEKSETGDILLIKPMPNKVLSDGPSSSSNTDSTSSTFTPRKTPSTSLLKSNNNNPTTDFPSSTTRPSFPSLVIALLNTVRATGGGGSGSGEGTTTTTTTTGAFTNGCANDTNRILVKSEKVGESEDSSHQQLCSFSALLPNLNLNPSNTNHSTNPSTNLKTIGLIRTSSATGSSNSNSSAQLAFSSSPAGNSTRITDINTKIEDDENGNNVPGENADSTPAIKLPENLEGLMRADHFPCQRHRWNTNEEIAAILISFTHHPEWLSKEVKIRPKSGSMLLYSRKKVRYRRDGYCWKKRKDGKTTREDHMKLKVQGTECIYGCYVHSAILPTFHRRCYWLLQNPDIVLVHYLNVPYPDDNKLIITSNVSMWGDKKEWTKEELISQLKPMFFSEEEPDLNNELELSTAETVEAIVVQLMEKQRLARQTASGGEISSGGGSGSGPGGAAGGSSGPATSSLVNGNLNGSGGGGGVNGPTATARLSSSSSTSSLVQIPNIPSNGPSIVATVTTTSNAGACHPGSGLVNVSTNPKSLGGNDGHPHHHHHQQQQQQHHHHPGQQQTTTTTTGQQQGQQQQQGSGRTATTVNLTAATGGNGASHHGDRPFVLNLSQFQTAGGLIILNGKPAVTTTSGGQQQQQQGGQQVQCHTASSHHHASALQAAVHNLNNGTASLTSTLTASFMDVQNANESSGGGGGGSGNGVQRTTVSTSTQQQQTLLIHHSQNHSHFAAALATAAAQQQSLHQQQQQQHSSNSHVGHGGNNGQHGHHPQGSQQQSGSHGQHQQHTVHHPPSGNTGGGGGASGGGGGTGNSSQQQQQQHSTSSQSHHDGSGGGGGGNNGSGGGGSGGHQELLTLEMSHEDIQQTLSANMGMGDNSGDLEPMSPSADDVFVNLDAFDILADLSDDLDQSHHNGVGLMGVHSSATTEKTTIVDINPEWAYSEGGTKILIVGQFHNPHWDYSVHFGDLPVPAVYLQAGVLKCFCPPHSPGLVPIRVFSNGKQISNNSMVFEYKADMKVNLVPVPPTETSLKLCLIHRMECLEKCFHNFKGDEYGARSLEDSVVKMCVEMMSQEWVMSHSSDIPFLLLPEDRGMTLLHLAGALGYTRLVLTLIQWKRENPSNILDSEVDPWKADDFGLIPLMWCARHGHLESGIILAQWSPDTLQKRGTEGLNPAQIAVARGHVKLASELEKIQNNRTPSTEFGGPGGFSGLGCEELSLTSNLRRFHRCSSSISEDFGLKDCFFGQPDATSELSLASEEDSKVLTLAEQIIAAIPDRIKKESNEDLSPCESQDSSMMSNDPSDSAEFSFEFSDRNYRYYDTGTPCSSLSPASSCLQSPCSSSFTVDSPQPTTADFCEFLQASAFEKDFSNLTLSDREQRELYEAAKVIQKAYRSYKGRKKLEEEEKEKAAAVIIQNYYRRYKQYAYLRQVTQAALVIQSQYRNYCENKRFKKSQESGGGFLLPRDGPVNSQHPILRTYSQRRQHQAAKKIQQFMRQSKNNLWEAEEPQKITERACRKREATMSMNHEVLCPAPAKIALSSVQQHQTQQQRSSASAF